MLLQDPISEGNSLSLVFTLYPDELALRDRSKKSHSRTSGKNGGEMHGNRGEGRRYFRHGTMGDGPMGMSEHPPGRSQNRFVLKLLFTLKNGIPPGMRTHHN